MTRNNPTYQERKKKREELHASRLRDADQSNARYCNDAKALDALTSSAQTTKDTTMPTEAKTTAGAGSGNLSADKLQIDARSVAELDDEHFPTAIHTQPPLAVEPEEWERETGPTVMPAHTTGPENEAAALPEGLVVPDLDMAGQFIEALTGNRESIITVQTLSDNDATKIIEADDKKVDPLAKIMHGTLAELAPKLAKLNRQGAGIFICVNETNLAGRKAANIVGVRAIWGDFDGANASELANAAAESLPPSIEVETSPGNRHLYWLTSNVSVAGFRPLIDPLTAAIGSDTNAKTIERVLRIPGFFHCKGKPVMVRLLSDHRERRYTAEQIVAAFALDSIPTTDAEPRGVATFDALAYVLSEQKVTDLRAALKFLDAQTRETWIAVCAALCRSGEPGFQLFHEWSKTAPKNGKHGYQGEADCRAKFVEMAPRAKSAPEAIFTMAKDRGWINKPASGHKNALSNQTDHLSTEKDGKGGFIQWAENVDMAKVEWFWRHRLARGMFHLLGGSPATGKSTIAFSWAAIISSGGTFPDGAVAPEGKVLIWSGEDSYESTIKPRLAAAGANMSNIGFLSQPRKTVEGQVVEFDPAVHLPALIGEIEGMPKGEIVMLIIDPIVSMIASGDNNQTSVVRAALQPLVNMLEKLGIIGLGITHFTKGSESKDPKERFNGSSGYIALARVGFATVKYQKGDGKHLITVAKSNIGPEGGGYGYHIEQTEISDPKVGTIETSKIVWGDILEGDARTLIHEAETVQRDRPANKLEQAKALLRELLGNGPCPHSDIKQAAVDADIGWRTMLEAKCDIGARSERIDPHDSRSPYQWLIRIDDFDEVANSTTK
jgi:hypothetical protein